MANSPSALLCSSKILRMWFSFFLLTLVFQEYVPVQSGSGIDLAPYYAKYSNRTQQAILYMNPYKINLELILELLAYLGTYFSRNLCTWSCPFDLFSTDFC